MPDHTFAAIRRGKLEPGMADEFAKRVKGGAVPVLTKLPGFKAYYLVFGGEDTVMAVSLFTSKAAAEQSNARLMPWIQENLAPLVASPTEATEGGNVLREVQ